jgi:hypothetical protein
MFGNLVLVQGALVVASGPVVLSTYTSVDGSFQLTVPPGTYDVAASASPPASNINPSIIDGYVYRSPQDRSPVAGVTVTAEPRYVGYDFGASTVTDSNGFFSLTVRTYCYLEPSSVTIVISEGWIASSDFMLYPTYSPLGDGGGIFDVRFSHPMYSTLVLVLPISVGQSTHFLEPPIFLLGQTTTTVTTITTMSTTVTIAGTVRLWDISGSQPLSNALVEADGSDLLGQAQHFETRTAGDGTYILTVPAGSYDVTAIAEGCLPSSSSVVGSEGFTAQIDFLLLPFTVSPTVTQSTSTVSPTVTQSTSIITTTLTATTTLSTTVSYATTATVPVENMVVQIASSSQVSSLIFDSTRNLLNFTVSGPAGTIGYFNATIAKSLLAGSPVLLMDGVEHSAIVTQDANFWYVYTTYSHSVHQVTIGGSSAVPEFPSILLLAAVFMIAIAVIRPRRRLN